MRILYIGNASRGSTSRHRSEALRRLGCEVEIADPYAYLADRLRGLRSALHFRTGYRFVQADLKSWINRLLVAAKKPDVIWVDSGEFFGVGCLLALRASAASVVLFNHDDPTGARDGRRFDSLKKAIPFYDVVSVCREVNVAECYAIGARKVTLFARGYDEVEHAPVLDEIPESFRSDVAFVGTWMRGEGRDKFLADLISAGIPVAIWGDRWQRSPYWGQLRGCYRGSGLSGREYVQALQGAKICLGLLSRGNRDLSTTRSVEIPYAGGLLCAERTPEHLKMYQENEQAVFWSDSAECAEVCRRLLEDDALRAKIRVNGRMRVLAMQVGNEDICRLILDSAGLKGNKGGRHLSTHEMNV